MTPNRLTVAASTVQPYVHADERGVVFHDGRHTVIWPQARLRFLVETLGILAVEQRATRAQHEWSVGGYVTPGAVTLYVSDLRAALTLSVTREDFDRLRDTLSGLVTRGAGD